MKEINFFVVVDVYIIIFSIEFTLHVYACVWNGWGSWQAGYCMCFIILLIFVTYLRNIHGLNHLFYCLFCCQITPCTKDGINKITLTGCDDRVFCFGVRIVKRQTVQRVC